MKLSVRERIDILSIQPSAGSMSEARIIRQIVDKVKILEEEAKIIGLKLEKISALQIQYIWDTANAEDVEISFSPPELDFLKNQIQRIDAEKRVDPRSLDLFDKILGEANGGGAQRRNGQERRERAKIGNMSQGRKEPKNDQ